MTAPNASYSDPQTLGTLRPELELAAREVFELMLGCRVAVTQASSEEHFDITSMVGLAGALCGVLGLQCSKKAGGVMASKMLGIDPNEVGPELLDALGEISNMVAGNFKNKIPGLSDGCMLSVPTVIEGSDYSLHSLSVSNVLEMPLLFEDMPIVISLAIHT